MPGYKDVHILLTGKSYRCLNLTRPFSYLPNRQHSPVPGKMEHVAKYQRTCVNYAEHLYDWWCETQWKSGSPGFKPWNCWFTHDFSTAELSSLLLCVLQCCLRQQPPCPRTHSRGGCEHLAAKDEGKRVLQAPLNPYIGKQTVTQRKLYVLDQHPPP